jgi:hypothetical protein
MRCKKHITYAAKKMKARVIEHLIIKMLERNTTSKGRRRLNIYQINGGRNSPIPKI